MENEALDLSNPRAMLNLITPELREKISKLPSHLINTSESDILSTGFIPNDMDFRIRLNFWDEYLWAQKHSNMQMRISSIYEDICSRESYRAIVNNPIRLAYMICPFESDTQRRRRLLSLAWNEMQNLITMKVPVNSKTGVPDPKILGLKQRLFEFLHISEHGQAVQKIEQSNKNLNYNVEAPQLQPTSMEDLDEKLKQLEAKAHGVISNPQVLMPTEKVAREVGKITDAEFKR
jgi:hypothetical protein